MDPSQLTPEEQIARYDEIAALIAEPPADDAGKIGQFVQIAGIVNRGADDAEPAAEPAPEEPAAKAIAASPEGKANPAAAVAAIGAGLTLAQFKALAPSLAKSTLAARMGSEPSASRLGADAPATAQGAVIDSQEIFKRRAAEAAKK